MIMLHKQHKYEALKSTKEGFSGLKVKVQTQRKKQKMFIGLVHGKKEK